MNSPKEKLRIAVLIDTPLQPQWTLQLVETISQSSFARIVLVLVLPKSEEAPSFWQGCLWRAYQKLDALIFKGPVDPFKTMSLQTLLKDVSIAQGDIRALEAHDIDVALCFGAPIVDRSSASFTRFGIWGHRHADPAQRFGGPAGFWEVQEDHAVTGSALISLPPNSSEPPKILYQSWSQTHRYSVAKNRTNCFIKTAPFAFRMLRDLYDDGPSALEAKPYAPNDILAVSEDRAVAGNATMLRLAVRLSRRILRQFLRKVFCRGFWCLAFSRVETDPCIPIQGGFELILPSKDRYWADPFILERGGSRYVFFEECLARRGKAHISAMESDASGRWKAPVKVLERPYHLSYPFLFEYGGELYMIPETSDHKAVEAYRCRSFPSEWEFHKTLLSGVNAADATLAEIEGRWWMFVNINLEGTYSSDELFLYYADNPFGDWKPHERNPVKSDVRSARPAGKLFQRGGQWYRPAQDGSGHYGSAISINRIVQLTPHVFQEEEVSRITPQWHKQISRNHTFNTAPGLTVMDGFLYQWRFF